MSKPIQYIVALSLAIIAVVLIMLAIEEHRKTPMEKAAEQIEKSVEGVQEALERPVR